jgi:hypothetical protein
VVNLSHRVIHAQSENISLNGVLVSSEFLIPEGSVVELAIAVPLVLLAGRGKVIRARLNSSGNFSVAIALERPLRLMAQDSSPDYTFWQRHFSCSATTPIFGLTHLKQ